jgi:hypothetical protein
MQSRFAIVDAVPDVSKWAAWARKKFAAFKEALAFITDVEEGRCPLLETNGEGYAWRLSCPRTIDNALMYMTSSLPNKVQIVSGLLTANVASCMEERFAPAKEQTQSTAREIARSAASKHTRLPVRTKCLS